MVAAATLSLATALSYIPLSYASHSVSSHFHRQHFRRQNGPHLPAGWTAKGCITDGGGARTLQGASFVNTTTMTVESCVNFCNDQSFIFAGVEFGQECYCDNIIENNAQNASSVSDCSMACVGNAAETCGGPNLLNLYWSGVQPPPPPTIVPSVGQWISLGCYNDTAAARTLTTGMNVVGNVSVETCTTACFNAGFPLAGMEFADECYCGTQFSNFGAPTPAADCNMPCKGNISEICGGPNRLVAYNFTGTLPTTPIVPVGGGGGNTGSPVFPVTSGLLSPWNYSACFVDNAVGRVFPTQLPDNANVTVESCVTSCAAQNFTLAGIEFSVQCFCGDTLINGATKAPDSDCSMGCGGNATEACGGPNRLSVYTSTGNVTALPVPVTQNTSLPANWTYQGCLIEGTGQRVLPYQNIYTNNNSVEACITQCQAFGYPVAGVEFGDECYCGDVDDVTTISPGFSPEADCNIPCSGDPIHICGGGDRLSLYFFNGSLNVWHQPENIGFYELLIGGIVVPLIATVGINNKVTFLEKGGTGFPNSTGAYELDLSLVDRFDLAWREMHIKTDVFCSGSLILPDKGARQINVGGWSLQSTFGVRLYTPDGSPGVNGTNDWEENVNELSLQKGRWYPSALLLSNGSILVVGGETGSNAPPQPNLEILPTPPGGDTTVHLDYLERTDPNGSLYPFLITMPSGLIFIGYYNEARLIEQETFTTVKELPNMPGAVNNFLAGRTYPMEGTAVLLPLKAPYTDPVTVLVCGGSTIGAAIALDNCIHISPEVENATWTLERMPSQRVMPCMVALPNGQFMILNGAHQGVAGFGLATSPNLNALLYDPEQPVGQRISILNNTIVARLYHSEATLLPDGRVLVSGSDPQTNFPNGTVEFPEEFRIEVYIPPYLNEGKTQPQFNITETDWQYNGKYEITVQLFQGDTSTMRISLLAATSSTHGNVMGGRVLFPEFSCSGNTCTITAPPNVNISPAGWHQLFILDGNTPSHSAWVRIGGDPGGLGEWPNFPDFTQPGS